MIERDFDAAFVSALAYREKQIQQNYRPYIAVHKWFARRPGSVFRALALSEFADGPLLESYYKANDLSAKRVFDPFMGGGTPLVEAHRLGCSVTGCDINPMAYWVVREELEKLDLEDYRVAAEHVGLTLQKRVGEFYTTQCARCESTDAAVKYFLWVKQQVCPTCQTNVDLFPGYVVARDVRHPAYVVVCSECGDLNEISEKASAGACPSCSASLSLKGPAARGKCPCSHCGTEIRYPSGEHPRHRLFALEYYCPDCYHNTRGRMFKAADEADLQKAERACDESAGLTSEYVPTDIISAGDETNRLIRWGYRRFRDLFNERQLVGLDVLARAIAAEENPRVRRALATNFSDLLRYQNMLCRYDTMALKSLDVFSVHGFPVGLVQCESNLLGIENGGGMLVGSGGWKNVVSKYRRAKEYCNRPFEHMPKSSGNKRIVIPEESIGGDVGEEVDARVRILCLDAREVELEPASVDGVFTDPPYFANVQYAELMEFCWVWLRRLASAKSRGEMPDSVLTAGELTGNTTQERGLVEFSEGLSEVFQLSSGALKAGGPFAFTYHHNSLEAYHPVVVAVLDAGLASTRVFHVPGEMGGSIHISGTVSSITDSIFVFRKGTTWAVPANREELVSAVQCDYRTLLRAQARVGAGDRRAIVHGYLAVMAAAWLAPAWDKELETNQKLSLVGEAFDGLEIDVAEVLRESDVEADEPPTEFQLELSEAAG